MRYCSRRADLLSEADLEELRELHFFTFTTTAPCPDFDKGAWWFIYPEGKPDNLIAFAGVVGSSFGPGYAYLKRSGVLKAHRGNGLQRRLIRLREAWARKAGYHTVMTDTRGNTPSSNNLIAAGYRLFDPPSPWGMRGTLYFKKAL